MKKVLSIVFAIVKFIVWVFVITLLVVVGYQRITKNEKAVAGIRIFSVITESMVPEYQIGDSIVIKHEAPSQLKIGDDVTYMGKEESLKDKIVTHRIISIEENEDHTYKIQTKGIANEEPDPFIDETQIYGKVIYKLKIVTFINKIAGNLYGMYFAIFLPFGLLIFIEFFASRRESNEDYEEDDNERKNKENDEETIKQDRKKRRKRRRRKKGEEY